MDFGQWNPVDHLGQQPTRIVGGLGALLLDMGDVELALLGVGLDLGLIDASARPAA